MSDEIDRDYCEREQISSDLLMRADSESAQGRLVEAAYFAVQAGFERFQMGMIQDKSGNHIAAVEDWLSSAACFIRARAPEKIATPLFHVNRLADRGIIPEARGDLLEALQERHRKEMELGRRVRRFYAELAMTPIETWNEGLARYTTYWLPRLTGFTRLHYIIYRAARETNREIALEHLNWAHSFEPDDPNFAALLGYEFLSLGLGQEAIKIGSYFSSRPAVESSQVLVMLSLAYLESGDLQSAKEVAGKLIGDADVRFLHRMVGAALAAIYSTTLGARDEADSLIKSFEVLAKSAGNGKYTSTVSAVRKLMRASIPTRIPARQTMGKVPEARWLSTEVQKITMPTRGMELLTT